MGRAPCSEDNKEGGLKKGAWTAEEDEKLVSFIRKNKGHGSWRTLPKLAGLERCGKSCRLRWTNYLRPNIKRGNFSAEEERIIIQLHGFMGNKWSSIASHLPGRTDNEVKNHWNTHLKKRLTKMGIDPTTHLPLQFVTPPNQDAANYYSFLNTSHPQPSNLDDWRMALLQRSLQLDPTLIARQLAQWELARLEAEARLQLAASCSHANLQNYASNWLQNLQQSQGQGHVNVNDLLLQAALNLQLQASFNASNSAFPNGSAPLEPSPYCEATDEQLRLKQVADSWDSQENQPIASTCKLDDLYGTACSRGGLHASESEPIYTNTSGMATPETCSSESTGQLLCELPDLLSSADEVMPSLNVAPLSPTDHYDASAFHDSYWNKMLNLLGPATSSTLDAQLA